jgi:hypothetical protein
MVTTRLHLLPLLAVLGCGGGGASSDAGAAETSGSETAAAESSNSEAEVSSDESGTDSEESGVDTGLFENEPEVIFHEKQPMVVDLQMTLAPEVELAIEHSGDAGVVWVQLAEDRWRVRGLRPGMDHSLELTASTAGGESEMRSVEFTTNPGLPGFVDSFSVSGIASPPRYRLMDLSGTTAVNASGVAMVDREGVTRWYLGETTSSEGQAVWSGVRLRDDGSVHYTRNNAFIIKDELGERLLRIEAADHGFMRFHHDGIELPSGNFVVMSVEVRSIEYPGEGTLPVAGDVLAEFTPEGELVWTWSTFDHLDPQRKREGFDNAWLDDPESGEPAKDWTHGNGVVYVPEDDSLLVSLRHQDWIVKVDHETGEVVWRLGEEGDFTLENGSWFFHQHSPEPGPDGSLLLYDNAVGVPGQADMSAHSRAVIYALDEVNMTATQTWQDEAETFVSPIMSDADRLPGGNVMILDSSLGFYDGPTGIYSRLREVDPEASTTPLWSLETEPGRFMYRTSAWDRIVGTPAE